MWGKGRLLDLDIIRCSLINKKRCECQVNMKMLGDSHQKNRGLKGELGGFKQLFVTMYRKNMNQSGRLNKKSVIYC